MSSFNVVIRKVAIEEVVPVTTHHPSLVSRFAGEFPTDLQPASLVPAPPIY